MNDIQIKKSEVVLVETLRLSQGASIVGHCYDEEGNILPGATVNALSKANDHFTARCNNEGRYLFAGLPAGDYTVSINSYVTDPPQNVFLQMLMAKNSAQEVSLNESDKITLDLYLSADKS